MPDSTAPQPTPESLTPGFHTVCMSSAPDLNGHRSDLVAVRLNQTENLQNDRGNLGNVS